MSMTQPMLAPTIAPTTGADMPLEVASQAAGEAEGLLLETAAAGLPGVLVTVAVGSGMPSELTWAALRRSEDGGMGKTELLETLQSVQENMSACGQLKSCHPVCGESGSLCQHLFSTALRPQADRVYLLSTQSFAQALLFHNLSVQEPLDGFKSPKQSPFAKHQAGEPSLWAPQQALGPGPSLQGLSSDGEPSGK